MIPLEPGMRVRCVDASGALFLDVGRTYNVLWDTGDNIFVLGGRTSGGMGRYAKRRFKPIVRVKARCVRTMSITISGGASPLDVTGYRRFLPVRQSQIDGLDALIKQAVAAFDRLSPDEKAAAYKAQAESWARSCVGFD